MPKAKPLIVHVMGYYPPHLGGAEIVTQMLAEHLAQRNFDVLVLTSTIGHTKNAIDSSMPHLSVKRLKAIEFAHTPFMPGLVMQLTRLPRNSIIHLHLAQAYYPELVMIVAKLRGLEYVLHFHLDLQPSGPLGKLFLVYKKLVLPTVIRQARKVIVFSDVQQAFIHKRYGVARSNIAIIPNGVGEDYFFKPRIEKKKKSYSLLYVGRLSAQKRVHILVEAMALINSKATLTIIGDGEDREDLEKLANERQLTNISFLGYKKPDEIRKFHRTADAFVLSSEREGMPLAVLEAMAAGLPLIASDVPGLAELLNGIGLLVGNPSGPTFAKALDSVLANPSKLAKLSNNSFKAAQAYSWTKVTDAVENLYKKVEAKRR